MGIGGRIVDDGIGGIDDDEPENVDDPDDEPEEDGELPAPVAKEEPHMGQSVLCVGSRVLCPQLLHFINAIHTISRRNSSFAW
jgi:hypothetical protein